MKVVKKLNLDEVYEVDGGFFYIKKVAVKSYGTGKTMCHRYHLKTFVPIKSMKSLKKFITTHNIVKEKLNGK